MGESSLPDECKPNAGQTDFSRFLYVYYLANNVTGLYFRADILLANNDELTEVKFAKVSLVLFTFFVIRLSKTSMEL